jgi:hypothetical protein
MTKLIASLDLDEVSLVRDPANPEARVALFKTGGPMKEDKIEELKKELNPEDMTKAEDMPADAEDESEDETKLEIELEKAKADMGELQKSYDALSAAVDALGFTFENGALEKASDVEYITVEGERIAKSSVPAVILKALEAKDAEIKKAADAQAMTDLRKRAGDMFPNLRGTIDQRAELLKSLEGMPEGVRKEVTESLKAADQAMAKVYGEEGKAPASEDMKDPEATLNKMVDDFAKANKTTFYKAYASVVKTAEGRALLKQIDKE